MTRWLCLLLVVLLAAGCGDSGGETSETGDTPAETGDTPAETGDDDPDASDPAGTDDASDDPGDPDAGPTDDEPDTADDEPDAADDEPDDTPVPVTYCSDGVPEHPFQAGGTGTLRHQLIGDFELPLAGGGTWKLSEEWTGCDVLVFVPDTLPTSQTDGTSLWENGILDLIARSPGNVHYFFVSRAGTEPGSQAAITAMADRIAADLAASGNAANWWTERLHVAAVHSWALEGPVGTIMSQGVGAGGFVIDRFQHIRGFGSMADVFAYNQALSDIEAWPWEARLAYAAYEAAYHNAEAAWRGEAAAIEDVLEIPLWTGEVIEELDTMEIALPDAATLAQYDTFEIAVDMRCPDPTLPEAGNCGAWDYLAHFSVQGEDEAWIELGRFITSYHRETRWLHDVTPMVTHILDGGTRTFRWLWAPEWNKQPTETRVSLRFSNQGKADKPFAATWLYEGGGFNSTYNDKYEPVEVAIPEGATRAELYVVITGHGADTSSCSEFCQHMHQWSVNGELFIETHTAPGQQDGCIGELANQMIPNQWGTWWFGRGGWCPGQPVEPWVQDVSHHLADGDTLTVTYKGLLGGTNPPDNAGNILMTSYLVFYQ